MERRTSLSLYHKSELLKAVFYNGEAGEKTLRIVGGPFTLISDSGDPDLVFGVGTSDLVQEFFIGPVFNKITNLGNEETLVDLYYVFKIKI